MPVIAAEWHLSVSDIGFLFSGTFFGQPLGALLFPYLAEKYGRLRACTLLRLGCRAHEPDLCGDLELHQPRILSHPAGDRHWRRRSRLPRSGWPTRFRGRKWTRLLVLPPVRSRGPDWAYIGAALLGVPSSHRNTAGRSCLWPAPLPALIAAIMRRTVADVTALVSVAGAHRRVRCGRRCHGTRSYCRTGAALQPPDVTRQRGRQRAARI